MWWLLGALGMTLVGWGLFSCREVLYPERRPASPSDPLPMHTTHALRGADGSAFQVWRLEAPAPRACLLVFHGYYADRRQVFGLASALRERGYEALVLELRGHGTRPGPCTFGVREVEDAEAVLHWARELTHTRLPVAVLGWSMGAAVACRLAARHPEVRAVVADSVYACLYPIVRFSIKRRYHLPAVPWAWVTWWTVKLVLRRGAKSLDPVAIAQDARQPLLAIQGGEDEVVPPAESERFYQRWGGPKERWLDPAAEHVGMFAYDPQAYCARVADFLDRALTAQMT